MAEEKKESSSPWEPVMFLALLIGGLFILWYINGGPQRSGGLRGIFISPLPPVGNGEVYGPEIGNPPEPTTNQ